MTAKELRRKYLEFFKSKRHVSIPSASLIPKETDPTVLFTTAGMHPLVPYLLGENHPGGNRIVNIQKCIRTADIEEVGDNRHLTFFEMMGNWSFGDYFKKEAINWSWEFLTDEKWLGLEPQRIYVTIFRGEDGIPKDEDSIKYWKKAFSKSGIKAEVANDDAIINGNIHIIPLGTEDNFWIAGNTGPCGPDTEMFYDTRPENGLLDDTFENLVNSGRLIEIWNNVFMEFEKTSDGKYEKLSQQNVDTGMGLERTLAVMNGNDLVFDTELFQPVFERIEEVSGKKYGEKEKSFRVIADHIKAGVFMIADGIVPSNVDRGYVLRRLIRRAIRHGKVLDIENGFIEKIAEIVIGMYKEHYPEIGENRKIILDELNKEEDKFRKTLISGLKRLNKFIKSGKNKFWVKRDAGTFVADHYKYDDLGKIIFDLYQTYGFPIEITFEELRNRDLKMDEKIMESKFNHELEKHQKLSRTASAGKFKGGLVNEGVRTAKLHTGTHLLLTALRKVLGEHVCQKGSNITAERLRFDFAHPEKMTDKQKKQVEDIVNEKIKENIPVITEEMTPEDAKKVGAIGVFGEKYGDTVKVYSIGGFSKEICGGPHVKFTGELGEFRIKKEESSSSEVRRIKATLK